MPINNTGTWKDVILNASFINGYEYKYRNEKAALHDNAVFVGGDNYGLYVEDIEGQYKVVIFDMNTLLPLKDELFNDDIQDLMLYVKEGINSLV